MIANTMRCSIWHFGLVCLQRNGNPVRFCRQHGSTGSRVSVIDLQRPTFGKLIIKGENDCHVHISQLEMGKYPSQDKVVINAIGFSENQSPFADGHPAKFVINHEMNEIKMNLVEVSKCCIQVPIKFDVNVHMKGCSNVFVGNLENSQTQLCTEEGNINLKKMKSKSLDLSSLCGDIVCSNGLQGSINVLTDSGNFSAETVQGSQLLVNSATGKISCGAVYTDVTHLSSSAGIFVKSSHRKMTATSIKGNIDIGTADGDLTLMTECGNISALLMQPKAVRMETQQGSIYIKVAASVDGTIEARGEKIIIEEELLDLLKISCNSKNLFTGTLKLGEQSITLAISPNGLIRIELGSWLSSFTSTAPCATDL